MDEEVAARRYASRTEVVREALRLLQQQTGGKKDQLELVRSAVILGIDDWQQGRLDDRPIREILDELAARG
jgi:Arc/MetJ-type ribon-helix-helix transcriptional regulator